MTTTTGTDWRWIPRSRKHLERSGGCWSSVLDRKCNCYSLYLRTLSGRFRYLVVYIRAFYVVRGVVRGVYKGVLGRSEGH